MQLRRHRQSNLASPDMHSGLSDGTGNLLARTAFFLWCLLCALALAVPAVAAIEPFPSGTRSRDIAGNGVTLHVRTGGAGPAVLMLRGFGDTGDMWAPLAKVLVRDHTIIVPDLRGMGLSSHPASGYDKKNQGVDVARLLDG